MYAYTTDYYYCTQKVTAANVTCRRPSHKWWSTTFQAGGRGRAQENHSSWGAIDVDGEKRKESHLSSVLESLASGPQFSKLPNACAHVAALIKSSVLSFCKSVKGMNCGKVWEIKQTFKGKVLQSHVSVPLKRNIPFSSHWLKTWHGEERCPKTPHAGIALLRVYIVVENPPRTYRVWVEAPTQQTNQHYVLFRRSPSESIPTSMVYQLHTKRRNKEPSVLPHKQKDQWQHDQCMLHLQDTDNGKCDEALPRKPKTEPHLFLWPNPIKFSRQMATTWTGDSYSTLASENTFLTSACSSRFWKGHPRLKGKK